MEKYIKIFVGIIFFLNAAQSISQKVENVSFKQEGNFIIIDYKITQAKYDQIFYTMLYVSTDGGVTFSGPLKEVEGDVGKVLTTGKKQIIWNAIKEKGGLAGSVIFDVKVRFVKNEIKRKLYFAYSGSIYSPIGIDIGIINKKSFYISARLNPDFFQNFKYESENEIVMDFPLDQYYIINNKLKKQFLSLIVGYNQQVWYNHFIYAGIGYGVKNVLWNIDTYNYSGDELENNVFIKNNKLSGIGVVYEGGFIFRKSNLLFKLGMTGYMTDVFDVNFGIGYQL